MSYKLKFVVDKHNAKKAGLHYDLRIQKCHTCEKLYSWAVPKGIPLEKGIKHLAIKTPDHEMKWLSFHGEIPDGEYGAGTIEIWDQGTCTVVKKTKNVWIFDFDGDKMKGEYSLVKIRQGLFLISKNN